MHCYRASGHVLEDLSGTYTCRIQIRNTNTGLQMRQIFGRSCRDSYTP